VDTQKQDGLVQSNSHNKCLQANGSAGFRKR